MYGALTVLQNPIDKCDKSQSWYLCQNCGQKLCRAMVIGYGEDTGENYCRYCGCDIAEEKKHFKTTYEIFRLMHPEYFPKHITPRR